MKKAMRNSIVLVLLLAVPFDAVTVSTLSTLCPTNKIAPHRKVGSWQGPNTRTIGAFYDLLTPNRPQTYYQEYQDELQENPQADEPDDCGEIEDYDENDLDSLQPSGNRQQRGDNRFFGNIFHRPPQQHRPTRPPTTTSRPTNRPPRPQKPNQPQRPPQPIYPSQPTGSLFQRPPQTGFPQPGFPPQGPQPGFPPQGPQPGFPPLGPGFPPQGPQPGFPPQGPQPGFPPQRPPPGFPPQGPQQPNYPPQRPPQSSSPPRPPYWSGGVFSNNHYQGSQYQNPSNNFKPVHETADYSDDPQSVYRPGLVGGALGHVVGLTQARPTASTTTTSDSYGGGNFNSQSSSHSTRRPRTRVYNNNGGVFGSFIDLLF